MPPATARLDVTIVGKGAALRSLLLREHLDVAVTHGLCKAILMAAPPTLALALEIDPGNPAITRSAQQIGHKATPTVERRAGTHPKVCPQLLSD